MRFVRGRTLSEAIRAYHKKRAAGRGRLGRSDRAALVVRRGLPRGGLRPFAGRHPPRPQGAERGAGRLRRGHRARLGPGQARRPRTRATPVQRATVEDALAAPDRPGVRRRSRPSAPATPASTRSPRPDRCRSVSQRRDPGSAAVSGSRTVRRTRRLIAGSSPSASAGRKVPASRGPGRRGRCRASCWARRPTWPPSRPEATRPRRPADRHLRPGRDPLRDPRPARRRSWRPRPRRSSARSARRPRLRPEQIVPEVGPGLEAVCLKALRKEQAGRYATATELAQEVQRYLADEPVQAYPEPWTRSFALGRGGTRWPSPPRPGCS